MFTLIRTIGSKRILDIGCGTGTLLKLLQRESSAPLSLAGVDASEDMLLEARKDGGPISFQYADAAQLPFKNETFDCVTSVLALHHMSPKVKRKALEESVRVVQKGGYVIIFDLFRAKAWWQLLPTFWFNLHSHTRGNWGIIMDELRQKGLQIVEEGTVRGVVGYLVLRRA